MEYQKYFSLSGEPQKVVPAPKKEAPAATPLEDADDPPTGVVSHTRGDRRDGLVYVYNEKIELAINVAFATGRPMLIRGPSGSGKSSLARNVANRMKWRFYERVITSRTQARDLLWNFDTLRRLNDAQSEGSVKNTASYIDPGILWWVFDPESAKLRGQKDACRIEAPAKDPGVGPEGGGAVLLLDEIDKADPDVPNNLLVPLGSFQFTVAESGAETVTEVAATRPLLVLITTNDERVLPNAFMRRCVVLELDPPNEERLIKIAEAHYGLDLTNIYRTIARRVIEMSPGSNAAAQMLSGRAVEAEPSTAEYLDTVGACLELDVTIEKDKAAWDAIFQATLLKRSNTPGL